MSISYRTVQVGDLEALTALMARNMPRDVISARRLAEHTLLEPNFDPQGLIIAEHRVEGVVGFLYATCATLGIPTMPTEGYLTVGCVDARERRAGIGSELLHRAEKNLSARGAERVTVAGYPQAYFWPGLDSVEYSDAASFLEQHGFHYTSTAAAMNLNLDAWAMSSGVRDLIKDRETQGYEFRPALLEDLPEVIDFANHRLAPDWGELIRTAALRNHDSVRRTLIARDPGRKVVGFATYGAYGDLIQRFGPFGVDETQRGVGLGRILLNLTLAQMRSDGTHGAWFLWTGENSPAGLLYQSTGFEVARRFSVMQKKLTEEAATEPLQKEGSR